MSDLADQSLAPRPTLATFTYQLAAGAEQVIHRAANSVRCTAATGVFEIGFDDDSRYAEFEAGLAFKGPVGWTKTKIKNPGGVAISVSLAFALGSIDDSRVTIPANTTIGVASPTGGDSDAAVACADSAATLVLAENANRAEAIVCNDDAAASVYVRFGNTAAVGGIKLGPGDVAVLNTTAAVYVFNNSGGSVNVLPSEIER